MVHLRNGLKVSSTASRGKKLAARNICGNPEENYKVLYKYLYMIEKVNRGKVTNVEADGEIFFKYMFPRWDSI